MDGGSKNKEIFMYGDRFFKLKNEKKYIQN